MGKQIISNKVYESLQVPTNQSRNTTGKVLYANRFSGIAQVDMHSDLKELINSDLGLIGNNILVQLNQKMNSYRNGPWYVDSRDGIIYIHNRKFNQEPEYNYIYQHENGEVIRVSFTMQNIKKNTKAQITKTINPEDKSLLVGSSATKEPEEENRLSMPDYSIAQIDNTMVSNWASANHENYRSHPTTPLGLDMDINQRFGAKAQKHNKAVKEYGSKDPSIAYQAGKQEFLDNLSTEKYKEALNTYLNHTTPDKRSKILKLLKSTKNKKNLESNLKQLLEEEKVLFKNDTQMEYLAEEEVDPREYDPKNENVTYRVNTRYWDKSTKPMEDQAQRGLSAMEKNPYIVVIPGTYHLDVKPLDGEYDPSKYGNHQTEISAKVKIRRLKKANAEVPVYQLFHNLFGRYGGSDKIAWAMNANANGGLKIIEKKLVCQMTVVGRPSLQSSQVIYLGNVGERWSGYWYIKSVRHTMDSGQGYLCTLDLVKNNSRAGQVTSKTSVNTQDIVSNDAKDSAKTDFGKDKKNTAGISDFIHTFTELEAQYFKLAYMNDKGVVVDKKGAGEFLQNKFYASEINAKDPNKYSSGTVGFDGNTVTSDGELIPGKLKLIKVKPSEVTPEMKAKYSFDWAEWARKEFERVAKNKRR